MISTRIPGLFAVGILLSGLPGLVPASDTVNHQIRVKLDPQASQLQVEDRIVLPATKAGPGAGGFILHADLQVSATNARLKKQPVPDDIAAQYQVPLAAYQVEMADPGQALVLNYQGRIHHPIKGPGEASARSVGDSPGIISGKGVFLADSSAWFPRFGERELVSFDLTVEVPEGWGAVSQGELVEDKRSSGSRIIGWRETSPQDDIYLVASRYHEYRLETPDALAMVFLRSADDALAKKYLEATSQYLGMYARLIGPYPYKKFALVENFWDTGYGMPSFTLLGGKVIRLPFIIYSSYPHEILHNYWGNGVYVDYASGNWAEGLTAYLADHLLAELRGRGGDHRRNVLQKYTDFVNEERDFALTEFRSRHSSASEAVGYGKTMMLFHMLRRHMGDEQFVRALRHYYKNNQFRIASFDDVQKAFSQVSDEDMQPFFRQWVQRPGAPKLKIEKLTSAKKGGAYRLDLTLAQTGDQQPYRLEVPVLVYLQGQGQVFETTVRMDRGRQTFQLALPGRPTRVEVDPQFDVFRRLDSREIPSALSQGFGDDRPLLVLPASADKAMLEGYRKLAGYWQASQNRDIEIVLDTQLKQLPRQRSVWLLGRDNRFRDRLIDSLGDQGVDIDDGAIAIRGSRYDLDSHSVVLTARHPDNPDKTLLWLSGGSVGAIPGLARKLPHYRKYSYLVFAGDEPTIRVREQWPVLDSPMQRQLIAEAGAVTGAPAPRAPLAKLPPVPGSRHGH